MTIVFSLGYLLSKGKRTLKHCRYLPKQPFCDERITCVRIWMEGKIILINNWQVAKMSPKIETQKELTTENQSVSSFQGAPGGNRTRTDLAAQGIFLPTMAFATIGQPRLSIVCGPDYSFTMDLNQSKSLGVSCLVSAPSSFKKLGSRLPSA